MTGSTGPEEARLLRTPLYDFHRAHGAHLVPFNGWEMPLYYTGILDEHAAVRNSVGIFDVSHMGILTVTGGGAAALLSRRTTANAERIVPGQCRYSFWLNADGMILDDLLLDRVDPGTAGEPQFVVIPNAGRAGQIFDLLRQHRPPEVTVARHNGSAAIVAVQGPRSRELLERQFGWSLGAMKFYTARFFPLARGPSEGRLGPVLPAALGAEALVSRTGYTGELGFELLLSAEAAPKVAEALVAAGAKPCGLGARDSLRLEKGYLLSGSEFNLDRTPLDAGQDRFVELDHPFVGRVALEAEREKGLTVRLAGIATETPGAIPRHGTPVLRAGQPVAVATSGGLSPTLGYGLALAYLPLALGSPGTELAFSLRGREVPATVRALPFLPLPTVRR